MQYRREVDGQRALAVVPVMLFHAGFAAFGGGFVGVDVFFVISGYLITSIIVTEMQAGTFTLARFYERRARRILPALFLVMFVSLPFAWLWLIPSDMRNFSQSMVAVSLFSSNILFYLTSGYFGTTAEFKPLLHTWSLSVEEQYYVLFPLLLLLTWRWGRRWQALTLLGLALLSLAMAQWESRADPMFAFFLLPTRGWEILLGAGTALYLGARTEAPSPSTLAQGASTVGLVLIAWSVFVFDRNVPFPSVYTLVPTAGAALLILFATPQTWAGRLLGSRWLVGLGLISYSAYLWHQPLLAFARHRGIEEPGKDLLALLMVASVVLAFLSWKYVEMPFRDKRRFSRRQIFVLGGACSVLFIAIGLVGKFGGGFESRFTPQQLKLAAYSDYDFGGGISRYTCYLEPENTFADFSKDCPKTTPGAPALLVWGDSYAAALMPGLRTVRKDLIQYTTSKCPPVIDTAFADRPNCLEINRFVMREIQRLQPAEILLHGNWHVYGRDAIVEPLARTLEAIRLASPQSRVTVVGGVPQWRRTLPILAIKAGLVLDRQQTLAMPSYAALAELDSELSRVATGHGAGFKSALAPLCTPGNCLAVIPYKGGYELTAWDNGHLTEAGSMLLAGRLLADDGVARRP